MIKTIIIFLILAVLFLNFPAPAYCDGQIKKLSRGFSNLFTFPMEIPYQIKKTYDRDGEIGAITYGVLWGLYKAGFRALIGVYEIATFPIPVPGAYEPIITDPEFFFEKNYPDRRPF